MQLSAARNKLFSAAQQGARASLVAQTLSQGVSLFTLVVLYRLLDPADYGLLAVALPLAMLPRMAVTLGLQTAVLQADALPHPVLLRLWGVQCLAGLLAGLLTASLGSLLGPLWQLPELGFVAAVLGGGTLLAAAGNQHLALLERDFHFASLARLRLAALVLGSALAIACAWRGWGVGALLVQQNAELALLCAGGWRLHPWKPWRPAPDSPPDPPGAAHMQGEVAAAPTSAWSLVGFGLWYSSGQLLNYLTQNLDRLLLPAVLGEAVRGPLGQFSQAMNLLLRPVYLVTTPLTGVMVRSLAAARDKPQELARLTIHFFRLTAVLLFPLAAGLTAVGEDLLVLLGGEKWRLAGRLLALAAPAAAGLGLANLGGFVLAAVGRARHLTFAYGLLCMLLLQGLAAVLAWYGLGQASAEQTLVLWAGVYAGVAGLVWGLPFLRLCLTAADVNPWSLAQALWPAARAAFLMGVGVAALRAGLLASEISLAWRLPLCAAFGAAAYPLLAAPELRWLLGQWRAAGDQAR